MAFRAEVAAASWAALSPSPEAGWFSRLPDEMHDEQKGSSGSRPGDLSVARP